MSSNLELKVSVVFLGLISCVIGDLSTSLRYFETLHHSEVRVHSVAKRSNGGIPGIKQVTFNAFKKEFRAYLKPDKQLFSHHFDVVSIGGDGTKRPVYIDRDDFYTGHVYGLEYSDIKAYFEDGNFVATITTADDTIHIEPSWRHLAPNESYTMIVYKGSDVLSQFKHDHGDHSKSPFCGYVVPEGGMVIPREEYLNTYRHRKTGQQDNIVVNMAHDNAGTRAKRQAPGQKNMCPVMVVADHRFHLAMGKNDLQKTAKYLIGVMQRVNNLYKGTNFLNGKTGYGFEIERVVIEENQRQKVEPPMHYNENRDWPTKKLLEVFSRDTGFANFCLAHLFTHQRFAGGVLGLAYIASPRINAVGGVCSNLYAKDGYTLSLNTGWSSTMNTYYNPILTQQADLVTAHEFGHNWGCEHDAETDQCAPSASNGGKFLMYPYAVSGYETNNKQFSPCSRQFASQVLTSKADICFQEPSNHFCGNGLVEEPYEECDGGYKTKLDNDPCCATDCTLRNQKTCSDINHACCFNCNIRLGSENHICQEASGQNDASCQGESRCNGGLDCPAAPARNSGNCLGNGQCENGVCLTFCESEGKLPCACDNVDESCRWCCANNVTKVCTPYTGPSFPNGLPLPEGRPCVAGYCDSVGVCQKPDVDLVARIWNILDGLSSDAVIEFMRSNIVGTVIVFSLIIWIPLSIVITCIDKKKEREEKERREWMNAKNLTLLRNGDRTSLRVRNVDNARLRRPMGSVVNVQQSKIRPTEFETNL